MSAAAVPATPPPDGPSPAAERSRGYTRWKGTRSAQSTRWWVIARGNLSLALANRWVKVLLVASLVPGIVLAGLAYFFVPISARALDVVLDMSLMFAFLVAGIVGARMISEDRRQGAFLAHFARPVTRVDYVLGKLAALVLPILFVTGAPPLLAILVDASTESVNLADQAREKGVDTQEVDPAGFLIEANVAGSIGAVLWFSLIASFATAGIMLGISALATRARLAGVAWFALVALGGAAHGILHDTTRQDWPALLSWMDGLGDVSSHLLGLEHDPNLGQSLEFALLVRVAILFAAAAIGIAIVHEQIRRAEGGVR